MKFFYADLQSAEGHTLEMSGYRSIRQGFRELAYDIQGMLGR